MIEHLYGRNAARECLRARRRHIHKVILADSLKPSAVIDEIRHLAAGLNIPVITAPRDQLDRLATGHQGVMLETGRYPLVNLDDILARAARQEEPPFLLAVDHLEDPQNLGAILRTADAVGVHGVILPRRRAAGVTPAVVNASAGAAEHVWVAEVPNLVQSLQRLKEAGVWVVGLEKHPTAQPFHRVDLSGPVALVVGSEGTGLSRLARKTCDLLVQLPMRGRVESLNASVACALALYEIWRARGFSHAPGESKA
ncbi:MAG: 23S rRNA (guanosine(2251)-2'-O)-methyltransferase RlmB [Chloroflexi bacterium]|nr:MAG: 23S rRNA (guanosine(2251)-2'-O)-methyltransferase RlmB [Chloroflexota bacterium]